jgi:hypothetical protein
MGGEWGTGRVEREAWAVGDISAHGNSKGLGDLD